MCGIVGAVTKNNIINFLLKGIKQLEYRGYDSSGLAIVNNKNNIIRIRCVGKVDKLVEKVNKKKIFGNIGVAHTRWATHGKISKENTHPHISSNIIVVHNGIIENYSILRRFLVKKGYIFYSNTDTEVIAHLLHWEQKNRQQQSIENVIKNSIKKLHGNYSMVIIDTNNPLELIAVRSKSPLVIGLGTEENFIASDQIALLHITKRFIFLEEDDIAIITTNKINIVNKNNTVIHRKAITSNIQYKTVKKGKYRYYMEKEIYEQPISIQNTLRNRLKENNTINFLELGIKENLLFSKIEHIQIVACGTSYNAAMVSRYWFESLIDLPCDVEISSEFSSRKIAARKNSFLVTLSQSGETADTLSALRYSKKFKYLGNLTICNMEGSSLVKESDNCLLTKAGIEIGVASTKSFTTQLTVLLMLVAKIANIQNKIQVEKKIVQTLNVLPTRIKEVLKKNQLIKSIANQLFDKKHILFIGRGEYYPIAIEGALKLKEISYIHAEAYAAGELKHGPLALIDKNIPVIIIAPKNFLLEKIKKNIKEISSRGGSIYVFSDEEFDYDENVKFIKLPYIEELIAPIFYAVPLQLLAYYIALNKRKNIDQPRHLAKAVTVE